MLYGTTLEKVHFCNKLLKMACTKRNTYSALNCCETEIKKTSITNKIAIYLK